MSRMFWRLLAKTALVVVYVPVVGVTAKKAADVDVLHLKCNTPAIND